MEQVTSGEEKQEAYRKWLGKFKKAESEGYYFECILIIYAMIEDRITSFLHYCGIVTEGESGLGICRPVKPYLDILTEKHGAKQTSVKNIRSKIEIAKAVLSMSAEEAEEIDKDIEETNGKGNAGRKRVRVLNTYMEDLYNKAEKVNRDDIIATLGELEAWSEERNKIIHALLNQKVDDMYEEAGELAQRGKNIARKLDDDLVKKVKRGTDLRKKYNIQ